EHEVGDVCARDEEEERDRARKNEQGVAQIAKHPYLQAHRVKPTDRVVTSRVHAPAEDVDLGFQSFRRDPGLQPADYAQKMRVEILLEERRVQRGRDPDLILRRWEIEIFRKDTDDGVRLPVHSHVLSEHIRLQPKFVPPKGVAENDDTVLAGFSFRVEKGTAESQLESQRGEKRPRHLLTENQLGLAPAGDGKTAARHG